MAALNAKGDDGKPIQLTPEQQLTKESLTNEISASEKKIKKLELDKRKFEKEKAEKVTEIDKKIDALYAEDSIYMKKITDAYERIEKVLTDDGASAMTEEDLVEIGEVEKNITEKVQKIALPKSEAAGSDPNVGQINQRLLDELKEMESKTKTI